MGRFFVIDELQAQAFVDSYFEGLSVDSLRIAGKLSPKILVVAPGQRLSWQYHHRRAEIWRVVQGPVGVVTSADDEQRAMKICQAGERIVLHQGERHRLVGLEGWANLAEIWQHTDAGWPSDEDDIVRVQDDFGRYLLYWASTAGVSNRCTKKTASGWLRAKSFPLRKRPNARLRAGRGNRQQISWITQRV